MQAKLATLREAREIDANIEKTKTELSEYEKQMEELRKLVEQKRNALKQYEAAKEKALKGNK